MQLNARGYIDSTTIHTLSPVAFFEIKIGLVS